MSNNLPDGYQVRFSMVVEGIQIRNHPYRDAQTVSVRAKVRDRDTGELENLQMETDMHPDMPLELALRYALRELVLHEIDESIRVNGVLVFDPHKDEQP